MTSLFTNVLLSKTISVIIEKVYKDNIINAKIKKNTLQKLIKDCCTKTVFYFNNVIYKQRDGVSMGSSLGPILANVIMTKLEKKILQPLIESGKLKFYIRYVDDTLSLAKEDDIKNIFDKFNSFHKNLILSMDPFEYNNVYFLDIPIDKTDTDLYYKPTHTEQYRDFNCSLPWN